MSSRLGAGMLLGLVKAGARSFGRPTAASCAAMGRLSAWTPIASHTQCLTILSHQHHSMSITAPSFHPPTQRRFCLNQTVLLRPFSSSHVKKPVVSVTELQYKTIEGKELLKDALVKRKELLRERRDDFVADMRAKKHMVRERVRTKMDEIIVERENVLTIPNLLTVGRAAMAPYLYYVVSVQGDYTYAMGLLALAGLTDLLDGQIARNWPSQASKMGSFLDPMADKLLVGALAVSMCGAGLFPMWLCGMVLFRDVFLVAAGFVIRYISLPPPKTISRYFDVTHATAQLEPTFISKVNTAVQLAAIASSLGAPIWGYVDHAALHGLWYFTGATTVAAALSYIISKDTYKIIAQSRNLKKR